MRFALCAAILAACATACATSPDGDTDDDASTPTPEAGAPDAGHDAAADASHDATADALPDGGVDSAVDAADDAPIDAPADNDAGPLVDAADAAPPTGLTWPIDQVFPSFAPIGALDVFLNAGKTADVNSLAVTLEGLVNRTTPRIYISDNSSAANLWLSEINAPATTTADIFTLVAKYRSEIAGIVVYDDAVPDTLNLATTIAGIKGGIVSSAVLSTTLIAPPYSMPVIADLRTNHFTSKLAVYQYELDNYAGLASHRNIIGLTPDIPGNLRDYAVATKAMMVWLDPRDAAEKAMLGNYLKLLPPNSPYMGWWASEGDGVAAAAAYGVPVYAADWSSNLTVLGGTPRGSTPLKVPPPPALENKLYIAIFMSDGDNLQEDEGLVPLKWSDSNRGNVPISWTLSPALVDVGPIMLRYFQRTATLNDQLVSGPSGLGYTYPAAWPSAATFDLYTQVTGRYMTSAGFRVATLWNNGADLSAANAQSYLTNAPSLIGLTIQDSTTARQFVNNTLPIERMTLSYGDNAGILENGVDAALQKYDRSKPVFATIQGNMNNGAIHPSAFVDVQSHYEANTNVVFVRSDNFFQLMKRANAPAGHKCFTGDFNGDGKTDSLFYYNGNGDIWLGTSNGQLLTWANAGNVAGFDNLLDASHAFYTGDFNGDGKTDLAFFSGGDSNWWVGLSTGTTLTWSLFSTNTTLGNVLDGKHSVHVGDYDGDGKTDFAVYATSGGVWTFGISSGSALTWKAAGAVGGFGDLLDGSHAFYDGDFDGDGKADVLFYYNGDKNLWLGKSTGTTLAWSGAGNTSAYGNLLDHGHRLWAGDFDGDHKTDLLFYSISDGNWVLGASTGSGFNWASAGSTGTADHYGDWNHRISLIDVDNDGKLDVASYDSASGDWKVGHSDGHVLTWTAAGNTSAFGDVADLSHLLWFGDYDGDGRKEPMVYSNTNNSWQIGHSDGTVFTWHAATPTGFGDLAN